MGEKSTLPIVDDDPDIADLLQDVLSPMFDEVESVEIVSSGVEKVDSNPYSLVLIDIQLQSENGTAIIKHTRSDSNHLNNESPVIIVFSHVTDDFRFKFAPEFSGIISKPSRIPDIVSLVESVVGPKEEEVKAKEPFTMAGLEKKVTKFLKILK